MRKGFTLIEVMIAVVIISTVILALLQMYSNNTHIFSLLNKKININQYATLFLANPKIGFTRDEVRIYDLVDGFDIEDDLRRELKEMKATILYQEMQRIDLADFEENDTMQEDENEGEDEKEEVSSTMVFEIGKSILQVEGSSIGYLRLQLK